LFAVFFRCLSNFWDVFWCYVTFLWSFWVGNLVFYIEFYLIFSWIFRVLGRNDVIFGIGLWFYIEIWRFLISEVDFM
jgi:hypothetical protein